MKQRVILAAGLAGVASLTVHGSGLIAMKPDAPTTLVGGPAQIAMIGNSFEDAVAGSVAATTTPRPAEPVEIAPPVAEVPAPSKSPEVQNTSAAPSVVPTQTASRDVPVAQQVEGLKSSSVASGVARSISPNTAQVLPADRPTSTASAAIGTTAPTPPTPTSSPPVEQIVAIAPPDVQTPDEDTPRPRARRTPAETQTRPDPAPQAQRAAAPGDADQSARAGQRNGQASGNAVQSQQGTSGQAASDGRAVAQYPQRVNRHLSRVRRPNSRFNGTAVITFKVASNGALAAVSVARSSGNPEFDKLAIAHIQRAAPFPAPPAGAQRQFNVSVRGR